MRDGNVTMHWEDAALGAVVADVCRRVRDAGGRAWLVGGSVRDTLRGEAAHDADAEVHGLTPDAVDAALRGGSYVVDAVGKAFAVFKLHDWPVDVALPRRERKTGPGHRGFDVEVDPQLGLPAAAARRDFTLNAIYLDPLTGELADPLGGRDDLAAGRLRHCSEAFAEDPLRVLRAMQLVARFDLEVAPETVALCRGLRAEELPVERVAGEWEKLLLQGETPSRGLHFLRDAHWLRYYPELARLDGCGQNERHHPEGDVLVHTGLCLDAFARRRLGDRLEDLIVGLAVLCHDLGKPDTVAVIDGVIRTYNHHAAGEAPTRSLLARLTRRQDIVTQVLPLVRHHNAPNFFFKDGAGPAAIRRLARTVGRLDRLVRVARADWQGRGDLDCPCPGCDWLLERAADLGISDHAPTPLVQGRHLIALGLEPSPRFKKLLDACYEAQLDGIFTDEAGAQVYVEEMVRQWR